MSSSKDREVRVGDTVRLVCDVVPGLEHENIPTKGMMVIVSETWSDTIHVNREWVKSDGTIYGGCKVIMAFDGEDWEFPDELKNSDGPKVGDMVRLICDHVPGVSQYPCKGKIVEVVEVAKGYIRATGTWTDTSGETRSCPWKFRVGDYELCDDEEFEEPSADDLKEATQALLALAEQLNG